MNDLKSQLKQTIKNVPNSMEMIINFYIPFKSTSNHELMSTCNFQTAEKLTKFFKDLGKKKVSTLHLLIVLCSKLF